MNTTNFKTDPRRDFAKRKQVEFVLEGKLPPQAPDLEEAVLGAMLLEKNSPEKVLDIIIFIFLKQVRC